MSNLEHISGPIKRLQKRAFQLTPPKPFIPKEYDEQERLFLWAHGRPAERRAVKTKNGTRYYWLPAIPAGCTDPRIKWLFATLNGVRVPIGLAQKMSRAGMTRGVLDIWLPVPAQGFVGLAGDMKRIKGGRLSKQQEEWLVYLESVGWDTYSWAGAQAAISTIVDYLS